MIPADPLRNLGPHDGIPAIACPRPEAHPEHQWFAGWFGRSLCLGDGHDYGDPRDSA